MLELAYEHMNNPQSIKIEAEKITADKVIQTCYMTANNEKISLLIGLLRQMDAHRSLVFVNTKRGADLVWGFLEGNGFKAAVLSGDVPQKKRMSLLTQFQNGELPILVATDVAPAVCIFPISPTYSTTTCRKMLRIMSTALAVPPGREPVVMPSVLPVKPTPSPCPISRHLSAIACL